MMNRVKGLYEKESCLELYSRKYMPASVAQSDVHQTGDEDHGFDPCRVI